MTEKTREYRMGYDIGKLRAERRITVKEEDRMVDSAVEVIKEQKLSWTLFCQGRLDGENSNNNK